MARTNKSDLDNPNKTVATVDLREVLKRRGMKVAKYLSDSHITNNVELMTHKQILEANTNYRLSDDFLREAVAHFASFPVAETEVAEEQENSEPSLTKKKALKPKTKSS